MAAVRKAMKVGNAPKDVTIRKNGAGEWVVEPGSVRLDRGDELVFSIEDGKAVILIPRPRFFEKELTQEGERHTAPGPGLRSSKAIALRVSASKPSAVIAKRAKKGAAPASAKDFKTIPYAVLCEDDEDFAVGNSIPVIIIAPPGDDQGPMRGNRGTPGPR